MELLLLVGFVIVGIFLVDTFAPRPQNRPIPTCPPHAWETVRIEGGGEVPEHTVLFCSKCKKNFPEIL
jgi:hypothetical protein